MPNTFNNLFPEWLFSLILGHVIQHLLIWTLTINVFTYVQSVEAVVKIFYLLPLQKSGFKF